MTEIKVGQVLIGKYRLGHMPLVITNTTPKYISVIDKNGHISQRPRNVMSGRYRILASYDTFQEAIMSREFNGKPAENTTMAKNATIEDMTWDELVETAIKSNITPYQMYQLIKILGGAE